MTLITYQKSLHETADAEIVRIHKTGPRNSYFRPVNDPNSIWLDVKVYLSYEQAALFRKLPSEFSLKSRIARCKFNAFEYADGSAIREDKKGPYRLATLYVTSWSPSFMHPDWPLRELFRADPVNPQRLGKFYVTRKRAALEAGPVYANIGSGAVKVPPKYRVKENGLLLLPTDPFTWEPGPNWSREVLQRVLDEKIERLEMNHYLVQVPSEIEEGLLVPPREAVVGSITGFETKGIEGIVETPELHGNARFHSAHTPKNGNSNNQFFVEFFNTTGEPVIVKEVGIRLYTPEFS